MMFCTLLTYRSILKINIRIIYFTNFQKSKNLSLWILEAQYLW